MQHGYKLPVYQGKARTCSTCGLVDHPVYTGEADPQGAPIFDHSVVIDVTYIQRNTLTHDERLAGYELMTVEGDRKVKVRMICRPCLQAQEDAGEIWKDFDKARREKQDESKTASWYAQFVGAE